ncbi:MAG: FKBP-type peptidyl-prolyl cis-trans isomerase, partial [Bacteroidota bacterium]|nr:FKBP-type peptidyl-prolyl cis-trans isomerase [Bacteroidota bacterium]
MKKVVPGALVEVAYTLHADGPDGEELEVCTEEAPFMFRLGEDEALEAFEQALLEKREGEPFEVLIACDDAYGQETEDAVLALPKETFKVDGKIDLKVMKPGEVVPMED